jgi:hypothetical protein
VDDISAAAGHRAYVSETGGGNVKKLLTLMVRGAGAGAGGRGAEGGTRGARGGARGQGLFRRIARFLLGGGVHARGRSDRC